ncbi:MAG TPA: ParB/Srx family N-terminal domain-containing protein, partial [Chthoniobacteraceae bacterium]|nr:ParB/Srx family N-terminal domain-containing protein [Chthoniobacteraceae bacterium]
MSRELNIRYRPLEDLSPSKRNARTHSKKQIRQIAESIEKFGFTNPILVARDGSVVAGHGRLGAAAFLKLETVPTIVLEDLSDAELRAYMLADNKLALNAGWDTSLLALEMQGLLDLGFDLEVTVFSLAEIDLVLDGAR